SLELFGKQRSSTGSTPNPYRFGGAWGYINGGSGLQQLGARFHWPDIGRFIQQDPIGDGMNWYAYVGNNPAGSFDADGARETTPGCAQAIREAETAQKEIERRLAEMERYNPSTPPRVVWPRGPFDPDNYADAGGGGVVLCGGKRSTRGKTPEQIHSGHKRQVESWQQRLKNKLREIDEKCSEEDKKEHAARIGKLRPWVTKPVPGFAGAVPVVPLPGLGGLAPVPAPAAPVAPPAGPLMPLRVPIWGFA
ncbi:MAG: RHS repeat-associated core domain-containing protein, partial [Armatimonadota bacterium]